MAGPCVLPPVPSAGDFSPPRRSCRNAPAARTGVRARKLSNGQYSLFRFVSTCPRGWSQPRWSYLWHEMLQRPVPESAPGNCPAASTPNPVLSLLVRVGGPSRGGAICGPECSSGQYPSPRRTLSSGQYSSPGPKTRKKKSKLFIPYTYCQLS